MSQIIEKNLLVLTPKGLYCPLGDVYIDPWVQVDKSLVTHAHRDHISFGCGAYLCTREGVGVLGLRVGADQNMQALEYGEELKINDVTVSFYPAGHIIGSAQILLQYKGMRLLITGDYKLHRDSSCRPFELVKCDTLITECTFGLPVFQWPDPNEEIKKLVRWWSKNRSEKITPIVYAYPLGKSQRILSMLTSFQEEIVIHSSLLPYVKEYEKLQVAFPKYSILNEADLANVKGQKLIIAPNGFQGSRISRKLHPISEAHVSGWVKIRGLKKRRGIDQGFVISDHVDWEGLQEVISQTGANRVFFTHGFTEVGAKHAAEKGLEAGVINTRFGVEESE